MIMIYNYEELRELSAISLGWGNYPPKWNPIENDSDCCCLIDNLGIEFRWMLNYVEASCADTSIDYLIGRVFYSDCNTISEARRLAVVRIAAEIGKNKYDC